MSCIPRMTSLRCLQIGADVSDRFINVMNQTCAVSVLKYFLALFEIYKDGNYQ
jgi:hypothetical protein